jgi:PAS domain S-box-containing protein
MRPVDTREPSTAAAAQAATTESRRLAESEERLQLALSAGRGIGTWDWDVVNDRVVADERFARLYGVTPERAREGAPIAEFFAGIHPDDAARVRERVAQVLASGELFSEEYRLVHADGGVCWVLAEGRCKMAADGTPHRFPGVSFDVTDRKVAEQRLHDLNLELERQVIERSQERGMTWQVSPDLLGALNSQGYFVTSNPAWMTVLGWTEAEVAGMSIFELLHPTTSNARAAASISRSRASPRSASRTAIAARTAAIAGSRGSACPTAAWSIAADATSPRSASRPRRSSARRRRCASRRRWRRWAS